MLAIIPAKGNSEGVPLKNIAEIDGVPLIVRCIETALESESITRVAVSSDSEHIRNLSEKAGAIPIERPGVLAQPSSSSESVLLHALENVEPTELTVFLQCTAPLMTAADIDGTVAVCKDTGVAVAPFEGFLWASGQGSTGFPILSWNYRPRRQDREPMYVEAGSVYVMNTEGFLKNQYRFFGKTGIYSIDHFRHLEIDYEEDVEIARKLIENPYLRAMQNVGRTPGVATSVI